MGEEGVFIEAVEGHRALLGGVYRHISLFAIISFCGRIKIDIPEYQEDNMETVRVRFQSEEIHMVTTGRVVYSLRQRAKLTQCELAKRLGLTQARISQIENDKFSVLTVQALTRISKECGFELELGVNKL